MKKIINFIILALIHSQSIYCAQQAAAAPAIEEKSLGIGGAAGYPEADEKSFKCDFDGCAYETSQKSNLERHMRTHTYKIFECDTCGERFGTATNLINHKRTQDIVREIIERPYK